MDIQAYFIGKKEEFSQQNIKQTRWLLYKNNHYICLLSVLMLMLPLSYVFIESHHLIQALFISVFLLNTYALFKLVRQENKKYQNSCSEKVEEKMQNWLTNKALNQKDRDFF